MNLWYSGAYQSKLVGIQSVVAVVECSSHEDYDQKEAVTKYFQSRINQQPGIAYCSQFTKPDEDSI